MELSLVNSGSRSLFQFWFEDRLHVGLCVRILAQLYYLLSAYLYTNDLNSALHGKLWIKVSGKEFLKLVFHLEPPYC